MFEKTLTALFAATSAFALYVLCLGFSNPALFGFDFRQTQTALTAYWLTQGGKWIAYETPVLGAPWSIPFEFPIYQWIVALVSGLGLSIAEAGRLVSFAFLVLTLLPIRALLRTYRLDNTAFLLVAILYLASPLYLFWGRTVMIETAAVFFATCWLAFLASGCHRAYPGAWLAGAYFVGCLACLTKSTTFPAFAFVGAAVVLHATYGWWRARTLMTRLPVLFLVGLATIGPIAVAKVWVDYSDAVKALNPLARDTLVSSALTTWNFGTLEQRQGLQLWRDTILERSLPELFGYGLPLAFLVLGATLLAGFHRVAVLVATSAFLVAMLLFANLHIVHNYYQTANGIFALAAVGIGLHFIATRGRQGSALFLLVGIVGGQLAYFERNFTQAITLLAADAPHYTIGRAAHDATPPHSGLLIFGDDWSSAIPYYAERKGFAVPLWAKTDLVRALLSDPEPYFGDYQVAAIVDCFSDGAKGQAELVRAALSTKRVITTTSGCRLLEP